MHENLRGTCLDPLLDMRMKNRFFLCYFTLPPTAETMYNSQQQLSTSRSESRRPVLLSCFAFDRLCSFNERMEQSASVYLYVINVRKITIKTLYLVCPSVLVASWERQYALLRRSLLARRRKALCNVGPQAGAEKTPLPLTLLVPLHGRPYRSCPNPATNPGPPLGASLVPYVA